MHELEKPDVAKNTTKVDGETQHHQQQIIISENAEHQNTTHVSPTTQTFQLEVQSADLNSLIDSYSYRKLAFLIKMAFLQNIKALGYAPSEEDVKREEASMEEARAHALDAWENIRERGFSYDVHGSEYLRSCTLQYD